MLYFSGNINDAMTQMYYEAPRSILLLVGMRGNLFLLLSLLELLLQKRACAGWREH